MKFRLHATPAQATPRLEVRPPTVSVSSRPLAVLDFDCEARPLSFIGGDYVSKEITAIAWAWTHNPDVVECALLGIHDPTVMLQRFAAAFALADVVTGHYIRGFDIPTINGALMEYRLPVLPDKLSHDTKLDLARSAGISLSQESLGAMLRLDQKKVQMNQAKWRAANRLTPEGIEEARIRCVGDVQQHIAMRRELMQLGYLGPARWWRSRSSEPFASYAP